MAADSEIELSNYFIFDPTICTQEGEEEKKILFFYPPDVDKDTQLKNAGLCEALIKFTGSFNPSKPCQSFTTEKTKQLFYEAEPNIWIVLTLNIPYVTKINVNTRVVEYQGWRIQENVYMSVLVQSYRAFKLFHGSFASTLAAGAGDISLLIKTLETFFPSYLPKLKVGNCDILDIFQGISFLPLGKEPFLHVQSFINLVETTFRPVKYSAFLYNDHLVWSGIEAEDMQVLYQYLVYSLLPQHLDLELQGGSLPNVNNSIHHYGSFVTGPFNLKESIVSTIKVPTVYLSNQSRPEKFHLVVYRALSATLCLFIDIEDALSLDLFKRLDAHLGPKLTALVSEVTEHCARQATSISDVATDNIRFVYFNKLNLAQKSTVHVENRQGRLGALAQSVPGELLRITADINAEKSKCQGFGEVIMKTLNDNWLVAKYSNAREFYVIVTQKKASLIDINDEVRKISKSQLNGIFFLE